MSKYASYHHIIFSTHCRFSSIDNSESEAQLYGYMAGIARDMGCFVHAINGTSDHVHILLEVPPEISVAQLMKELKGGSSVWAKKNNLFNHWLGWERGYGWFTISSSHAEHVKVYINNQKAHHKSVSFLDEVKVIFEKNGLEYNEKYLFG